MEQIEKIIECEKFLRTTEAPDSMVITLTNCYQNKLTMGCTYCAYIEEILELIDEVSKPPWWLDLLE
jgi:hypothetical protein|tara:strand:- start:143 stop:343 length:201 start_codon:yes stop_codon:yes gene_type:complete